MSHDIQDLKTALSTYHLISDLIDQIRNQYQCEGSKLLLNEETQEIYEKAVNAALQLYDLTGEFSYKDTAFDLTEKAKSNVLLTSLRDSRARHFSGIPADLLDREKN